MVIRMDEKMTVGEYLRKKAAEEIAVTYLFGRNDGLVFPRSVFEYEYEVRHRVCRTKRGEFIALKEPGMVLIEFDELPEKIREIIAMMNPE